MFRWRPSRQLQGVLVMLTAGAVLALLNCGLAATIAFPAAVAVLVRGAWLVRSERRRRPRWLELSPDGAWVDGQPVSGLQVAWRGPLAFLAWRDAAGRRHRLAWCPDALPARDRRRLRLALGNETTSPVVASVAP